MADEEQVIDDGAGLLPSLLGQYGSDESDSGSDENAVVRDAAGPLEQGDDDVEKGSAHKVGNENGQREGNKSDDGVAIATNGSKSEELGSVKTGHREMTKDMQAPQSERQMKGFVGGGERIGTEKYVADTRMIDFLSNLPKEFQCSGSGDGPISKEVDSKTERLVQQWKHLKDQGYTITDDLRKRNWYKSPDCMRLMTEKFEIDSGGTNLKSCITSKEQATRRGKVTIAELRKAWDAYEAKRKMERKTGDARIDFVKGKDAGKYDDSAVSKAVLAAQKRAATFAADRGKRDKVRKR